MNSSKLIASSLNLVYNKLMQSSRAFRLLVRSRICYDLSSFVRTSELKSLMWEESLFFKNYNIFLFSFLRYYYSEARLCWMLSST